MNNSKKIISLLLSVIMIMSVFNIVPFSVSAADIDTSLVGATDPTYPDYSYFGNEDTGTAVIYRYTGSDSKINIPSTLDGYTVTNIDKAAFAYCESLTSVTIPDSVTRIGGDAFYYCTNLISVNIGNSVTSIGGSAFDGCPRLTVIQVDSGNTVYDSRDNSNAIIETEKNNLLLGCQNTVIPNSVTSIYANAFSGCVDLTNIVIPDSVTSIGESAFWKCTSLTSITIPNSVTSIDARAFFNCKSLTSVTIPDSVTSIGDIAFGYYYDDDWNELKVDGFTIYGYPGSEAEKYAKDNEFTFVPLKSKTDEATGIILDVSEDTEISIKPKKGQEADDITVRLPENTNALGIYNIKLMRDGEVVQPDNIVTVKIPCTNENAKVYRFENDSTMTDMNAKYKDACMVFTTDHFSVYVLAEPEPEVVAVPGDVTGDDKTNVQDCTAILRYVRRIDTLSDDQLKIGDVTGDGKVNVQDVTRILRHVRQIEALY